MTICETELSGNITVLSNIYYNTQSENTASRYIRSECKQYAKSRKN